MTTSQRDALRALAESWAQTLDDDPVDIDALANGCLALLARLDTAERLLGEALDGSDSDWRIDVKNFLAESK